MSFADKAVKVVLEQLKKEGKEYVFNVSACNTGKYKSTVADYEMMEKNSAFPIPEEILDLNTVPGIIGALKNYYIEHYYSLDNTFNLLVAENDRHYGYRDDLEEEDAYQDEDEEEEDESDPFLLYGMCADLPGSFLTEKKSKEEIIKTFDEDLQNYLKAPEKTVSDFVIKKKNELKLKAAEIYKPALMTRQNYSKIVTNFTKHPKFEACIQLAFGLKLDLADTTELLRRAGKAFSDKSYDRIIMYFIENGRYDMFELNKALDKMGEEPIGSF
ncbi:hypothetical protein DYE50_05325 [Treponema ruminis]|uniref:Uncharacterized protein n=1 Tax=Treponema ruminis TaxID=744515 RepID=A0A7W8LMP1_9SPIR|nr:hypothetical protein [Treponema ruminis]MBB5226786.1 hypothetical protein [Treponema ruminis]QSI01991.1 hypothetical protein DYE50_05325 [Treponema ruminis]